jgi:hypothetical protein
MRIFFLTALLGLYFILSCSLGGRGNPTSEKPLSLAAGDFYFTYDGKVSFLYGKNATGSMNQIDAMIGWQKQAGGRFMRIHITHGFGMGITNSGGVDPAFLATWDSVFSKAAEKGISIIPVFGVWADFNDDGFDWSNWKNNPLNQANGGPGVTPTELFADTETQARWLGWMTELVTHSAGIIGGVIGNGSTSSVGWCRDAACVPPNWPVKNVTAQSVMFAVPGNDRAGNVYFYDPDTGSLSGSQAVSVSGNSVTINLPDFSGSIAFKLALEEISP